MFVIITCNNIIEFSGKTACSLWLIYCLQYFVFFVLYIFHFFFCSCLLDDTFRFYWIYSHYSVLVSLSKPKAVALVQTSICVCSLCLMLLCSQPAMSFQAYQTTIYADLLLHRPKVSALPTITLQLCIERDDSSACSKSCNISPAVTVRRTHRHTRLETTCRCSVWQSCKCFWDDGLQPLGTADLTSVELFDFHSRPACGQCRYCWPLLGKVTDYGMHLPRYGCMIRSQTPHGTSLLIFQALFPGDSSLSVCPCSTKSSNQLLLTSKGKHQKKGIQSERKTVWISLPLSFAYFLFPSLTHYRASTWSPSMFSSLLASPLAPDAAQITGPDPDSSMLQRPSWGFWCHRY